MRGRVCELQQRIVAETNLAAREVIRRAPIGVPLVEQFRRESVGFHDSQDGLTVRSENVVR